jgi:hypothetical protein
MNDKLNVSEELAKAFAPDGENTGQESMSAIQKITAPKKGDPCTLRARGGSFDDPDPSKRPTDPVGLSRSILHVLAEHNYVRVLSVGSVSLQQTMTAFRIAAQEVESKAQGVVLVARQSEYTAEVGNKRAKGVCTRIFAIPIQYAF